MKVERFQKRPVVVEAVQFDGTLACADFIYEWANPPTDECKPPDPGYYAKALITRDHPDSPPEDKESAHPIGWYLTISTLEGNMIANAGDWVIKGVRGEFYPCKPDIFDETYVLESDS